MLCRIVWLTLNPQSFLPNLRQNAGTGERMLPERRARSWDIHYARLHGYRIRQFGVTMERLVTVLVQCPSQAVLVLHDHSRFLHVLVGSTDGRCVDSVFDRCKVEVLPSQNGS